MMNSLHNIKNDGKNYTKLVELECKQIYKSVGGVLGHLKVLDI